MDEPNASNRRRSERVVLTVPVVVRFGTSDRGSTDEEAHTIVVNAHGGLLRLKVGLMAGQMITLINPKTDSEEGCHVVRVEKLANGDFAVAFEFARPAPQFWPVVFPPPDWELVKL